MFLELLQMRESLLNVLIGGAITAAITIIIWSVRAAWSARGALEKQNRDFSNAVSELRGEILNLRYSLEQWTREQMSVKLDKLKKEFKDWARKEIKLYIIDHQRECSNDMSGVHAPKITQKVPRMSYSDSEDEL